MSDYVILTDSSCDLPRSFIDQYQVPFVSLVCNFRGKEWVDDFGKTLDYKEFYSALRQGEMSSTSQVNVQTYLDKFNEFTKQNKPIIYIGFSSALSGSVSSAYTAQKIVSEQNPHADITIIDSKSASLGQGLLVYYAYAMQKNGTNKEDLIGWLENTKLKINHWFTVDSLDHLKRGGRISGTAAFIGNILNIKPILNVNDTGGLVAAFKAKGRKKALQKIADMLEENIIDPEEQVIAISHGDCLDEVEYLVNLIKAKYTFKDMIINHVGPVIGSHSGPGTIALFFIGEKR